MLRKNRLVPLIGLVLAAITLTGCSMKLGGGSSDPSPAASASASATPSASPKANKPKDNGALSAKELKAIADTLTVSTIPASAECKTDASGLVTPVIGSLLNMPPRLWPDAPSTPFTTSDPVAARAELQKGICEDSNLGSGWLTFTATSFRDELLAATGIDLLILNPRLRAYTDVSQITPKATAFLPLLNVKVKDRTPKLIEEAMTQNLAWQQDAALMNTLLERYVAIGIDTRQSIVNYKLIDYGQSAGALPVIGINSKPDDRPAQIFALTSKTQCGEIVAFGANTGDKRPELFKAKDCAPSVAPTCKVTATHKCTTTHIPTCEEKGTCTTIHVCPPSMPHGTWPVCKDDPSKDPSQNGNANTGGGTNADSGPGVYQDPSTVVQPPPNPYVRPAPPAPDGIRAPAVAPSGPSAPATSTNTGSQSNNGTVSGTGSGASCNPVVMNC